MGNGESAQPNASPSAPASSFFHWLMLALATAGFVGYIPYRIVPFKKWKGSGLLGSFVGWGFVWLLPAWGIQACLITAALLALSIYASHQAENILGSHDDPRIVIDEVL